MKKKTALSLTLAALWCSVACGQTAPTDAELRQRAEAACAANPACVAARVKTEALAKQEAAEAPARQEQQRLATEKARGAQAAAQRQAIAALDSAFKKLQETGFVTRTDGGARSIAGASRIYVDGRLWAGFKVDQKEDLITFLSRYRRAHENLPQVTLYDDTSGRELGSYGALMGVRVNAAP